jgi:chemotaxis protein methyltransferase CheR
VALTAAQFGGVRDALAAFAGIYLDDAQRRVLEAALAQRVTETGDDLERYERRVRAGGDRDELRRLAELVLNHETFFFRNQAHLRALRDVLLPEIHARKPAGMPIRIWSAGCSTGEEPYSIAIAALEALGGESRPLEVYGTDLSELALEKARSGFYRGRSLANVPPELLDRYFRPQGDGHLTGDALRSVVSLTRVNLLELFPSELRGCDVIFCQNVTIYFQPDVRRDLISRFYDAMPPEGLLLLGFSETLWNVFDGFRSREVGGAYVYYKGSQVCVARGDTAGRAQGEGRDPRRQRRRSGPEHQVQDPSARVKEVSAQAAPQTPVSRPTAEDLTAAARTHADRGDLELALEEIRRALELDALNDEAYVLLGSIYVRQGAWGAAVAELERARYLNPDAPLISFRLADAHLHAGRADLAAREYRSALRKLAPHPPDELLDGVAASWLRETCEQQLQQLSQSKVRR